MRFESSVKKVFATAAVGGAVATVLYMSAKRKKFMTENELLKNVHIITNKEQWNQHFPQFLKELNTWKVMGLDCEWVQLRGRRPVALLQLAAPHGSCLLVRLSWMGRRVPPSLANLLADSNLLKVGVEVVQDCRKLCLDYGLLVSGCVDLRNLASKLPPSEMRGDLVDTGLAGMSRILLDYHLAKDTTITCSNWEATELSEEQIEYAALDAAISLLIFKALIDGIRDEKWYRDLIPSKMWEDVMRVCEDVKDVQHAGYVNMKKRYNDSKRQKREMHTYAASKLPSRQAPLYYNCVLQAPDGQVLCTCDRKKANWYLNKDLGSLISEDPFTVRLNFEPSGRPVLDNNYYTIEKDNICVVCGHSDGYLRKNIVPHTYRKYFPSVLKEHQSHDIVLMCKMCHVKSEFYYKKLRKQLAKDFNAPIHVFDEDRHSRIQDEKRVRSAGMALHKNRSELPEKRIEELENIIKTHFQEEEITDKLIKEASKLVPMDRYDESVSHGLRIVQHFSRELGLIRLEKMWREHFLTTMQPKFLPEQWSVDHNHQRLLLLFKKDEKRRNEYIMAIFGINPYLSWKNKNETNNSEEPEALKRAIYWVDDSYFSEKRENSVESQNSSEEIGLLNDDWDVNDN